MSGAPTKQQHVYEVLRERILTGTYGPGLRIVIDQVASELGISALPVREAVRRLEAEGLVVYRANAGAHVAPADPDMFEESMALLALLEGHATALAAPLITEADLAELERRTVAMAAAMRRMDPLEFGRQNRGFHSVIYSRCPNSAIVGVMRDVERRLDAIRNTVFVHIPYRGEGSVVDHEQLIELIRGRAPAEEIEAAARRHKLMTVESFRDWQREHGAGRQSPLPGDPAPGGSAPGGPA